MKKGIISQDAEGRYIVKGVTLRDRFFPCVGFWTSRSVGSDRYGQQITEVADDLTWFKHSNGELAVLVTRKNSPRYGSYVSGYFDEKGRAKPGKTPYRTCMGFDTFHICNHKVEDYLDPSF